MSKILLVICFLFSQSCYAGYYMIGNSLTNDAKVPGTPYHIRGNSTLDMILDDPNVETGASSGGGWDDDLPAFSDVLWLQPWGRPNVGNDLATELDNIEFLVNYTDGIEELVLYAPAPPRSKIHEWLDPWTGGQPKYRRAYYAAVEQGITSRLPGVQIAWHRGGDMFYDLWTSGQYTLDELYRDNLHATYDIGRVLLRDLSAKVFASFEGDFDGNGSVDGADYLAWARGETVSPLNHEFLMDWQANFSESPSALTIPEPTSLMCLVFGLPLLVKVCRR